MMTKEKQVFSDKARQWHSAFIGKTGSGKTYAARGEVEDLLDAGEQIIIIDPTGAWPGLRVNDDGTPSGYNIAIFGGAHGDRPLTPDMAPALGRIAGKTKQSMILDLSGISLELEDQREIAFQFLRNLYRVNRKPIHLIIDEADEIAPQDLDKDTKELRNLVARIMARGRSLGFRCTLITQRPAKIDKNSISQIESMAVLRLTAPQDRKAISDWFSDKGGPGQKEILEGIGIFETGEGCVFSGIDQTYERRRFRKIRTYDTSSTPTDEEGNVKPVDTGKIDLAEVDQMVIYPEERDEEELEKAIARRRNIEEENKKLRIRTLKAESRYEGMRQVFVQIRNAIDQVLINDGLEAVSFADLLLLRNEVAKDNETDINIEFFDINDIEGPYEDITIEVPGAEDIKEHIAEANTLEAIEMPRRIMSVLEKAILSETAKDALSKDEITKVCAVTAKATEKALKRLTDENSIQEMEGKYSPLPLGFARQLSEKQEEALRKRLANPDDPLFEFSQKTIVSLKNGGYFTKDGDVTQRGQKAIDAIDQTRSS